MRILRTKEWTWVDIALLKWSALLFGALAGAFLAELVLRHQVLVAAAAVLLAVRPAVRYFDGEPAGWHAVHRPRESAR